MNKKIAAVAVAGLFAAPAVALAQSSVTISGMLKGGFENTKLSNYQTGVGTGRAAASGKNGSYGVVDDSSRLIFNVREDLGGGLSAIGQLDFRVKPDDQGNPPGALPAAQNTSNVVNGNSFFGLHSKSWGQITFGRNDLHYFNRSSHISDKGSLRADNISLISYAGAIGASGTAVGGGTAIAGATRTQNVVRYLTPNWGGFTGIIAYSSNPIGNDADMGNPPANNMRKGYAWNLNPNYAAANWQVGYSFWKSKPDGGTAAAAITTAAAAVAADQVGHRLYGQYDFSFGLRLGIAWDSSKLEGNNGNGATSSDGVTLSKRTVWSIPARYEFMGKHSITGHYTWAKKDTGDIADAFGNGNTKANMWAIGYAYDLSKRTSLALTYARINNSANAGYQMFTQQSLGLPTAGIMAGEDPRMFGTTMRHLF